MTELDRVATLVRRCSRCGEYKPWSDYWAAAKWPDGTMRRPQYRCKECVKAALRHRRRDDPEWAREVNRKNWLRIKAESTKHAKRREVQRQNSVSFREKKNAARAEAVLTHLVCRGPVIATELASSIGLSSRSVVEALKTLRRRGDVDCEVARPCVWFHLVDEDRFEQLTRDADRKRQSRRAKEEM